jgi:hypothetical protein
MKNLKKILLASLVPVFCLSQAAFADGPVTVGSSLNAIHTTVAKTSSKGADASLEVYVGQGNNSSCKKVKSAWKSNLSLKDGEAVTVDGDLLAQAVGLGYTCIQEAYMKPDTDKPIIVQYGISSNKSTYTSANPARQTVDLTKCGGKQC